MSITEELVNSLLEELNCETVFTIPLFGGIEISEYIYNMDSGCDKRFFPDCLSVKDKAASQPPNHNPQP